MKKSILITTLCLIFSLNTYATENIDPTKKKLIDTLLEQTGQSAIAISKQFSSVFIQQMTMILKQSKPDIDPRAFDILEDEINTVMNEELVLKTSLQEMMYPIYSKHFTADELKKIIELNNTDIGKKMIRVMPVISQEAMQAGQLFAQTLGPKIQQRLATRFKQEGLN